MYSEETLTVGQPEKWSRTRLVKYSVAVLVSLSILLSSYFSLSHHSQSLHIYEHETIVPNLGLASSSKFTTQEYLNLSASYLSGAVQVPTISYDDMDLDPLKDTRFEIFKKFHAYLFKTFPLTAKYVETVNTYGLLYTIKGSNEQLKPIVLMAHQDVLPVNPDTLDQWEWPPFDGVYDGEWLHGRGSADTKNLLVGSLEAVEDLLKQGWAPQRTVILSFGFDEEITGPRGAFHLAKTLLERYGKNGVEVILDEGGFLDTRYGSLFALPAVAEKGRVDIKVTILTPGGHSSMPPDHTGIGIAAELVKRYENDPFVPTLNPDGVLAKFYGDVAQYGTDLSAQDRAIMSSLHKKSSRDALLKQLVQQPLTRILVQTTRAVDTIIGGVKINALPEQVELQINHRIIPEESVRSVYEHIFVHAKAVAFKFGLELVEVNADSDSSSPRSAFPGAGQLLIEIGDGPQEPSPVSPYGNDDAVWKLIAGTTRHIFEDVLQVQDGPVQVSPFLMAANTDTSHYWDVSDHIYRYQAVRLEDRFGHHTVGEKMRMRSHISCIMFVYEFLQNLAGSAPESITGPQ